MKLIIYFDVFQMYIPYWSRSEVLRYCQISVFLLLFVKFSVRTGEISDNCVPNATRFN